MSVTLRFADLGWPVVSSAISAITGSPWNHVDLMMEDGRAISAMPGGVRISPPPEARRSYALTIPCTDEQARLARAFAFEQVGKGYDYGAVLSFWWAAPWSDRERWFCSELCAAALDRAGIIRIPRVRRVSPGDLAHMLAER